MTHSVISQYVPFVCLQNMENCMDFSHKTLFLKKSVEMRNVQWLRLTRSQQNQSDYLQQGP